MKTGRTTIPSAYGDASIEDSLATSWPDFVDCGRRLFTLGPFLESVFDFAMKPHILDAAAGLGCEVCYLAKRGASVVANEISRPFQRYLRSRRIDAQFEITACDWRSLSTVFYHGQFDGVLLLGNSICLLLDAVERQRAVDNLAEVCGPTGRVLIDQRNFDRIWKHRQGLSSGVERFSRRVMYCGHQVEARPLAINRDQLVMKYLYASSGEPIGLLRMSMLSDDWLPNALERAGFTVARYYDLGTRLPQDAEFITFVASKR